MTPALLADEAVQATGLDDLASRMGVSTERLIRDLRKKPGLLALCNRERRAAGLERMELPAAPTSLRIDDPVLVDRVVDCVVRGPTNKAAAENVGCSEAALTKWIQRNPYVRARIDRERAAQEALRGHHYRGES